MLPAVLLWAAPFLVIPVSFLFYRFLPFKKARYLGYGLLLLAAFFLNLFQWTFHNDLFDTILCLILNFIAAEFFWNLLRLKKRKLFLSLLILALGLYGLQFWGWIAAGPEHGRELWKDTLTSSYRAPGVSGRDSVLYTIKEHTLYDHYWKLVKSAAPNSRRTDTMGYALKLRGPFNGKQKKNSGLPRLLILSKQIGFSPFEREIKRYITPQGFEGTDFIYIWSTTGQGARVDLHMPGLDQQIQTMGEGF